MSCREVMAETVVLFSIKGNIHHEVINRKRTSNTKYRSIKTQSIFFNKE